MGHLKQHASRQARSGKFQENLRDRDAIALTKNNCRQSQLDRMLTGLPSATTDSHKDVEVAHANVYLQLTLDNNGLHQVYSACLALQRVVQMPKHFVSK